MGHIRTLSIFLILILLSSTPFAYAQRGVEVKSREDLNHKSGKLGTYRALVIGIDKYRDPKIPSLKTAVNDARVLANLLQNQYGFNVELLLDEQATRKAITKKLRDLAVRSTPDESVLIYFAGHGEIDRTLNDGYWVPANATGGDSTTYVDNTIVQKVMKGMKAKHVLLISDSCYSGTLFGEARALPPLIDDKFYLNLYNEKSRWGMTSGNKTPVSDSGSEGHSIFAYQLIKALKKNEKPYVTTQEIYSRIAPIIANNSEQQPLCLPIRDTGDQGGGFVFVASTASTISATDSPSFLPKASPQVDKVRLDAQEEDVRLDEERRKLEKEKALLEKRKALEEQRRKVEEEKARHEAELQEAVEQKKLDAEQRQLEKERAALTKQKALEEKRRKIEEEKARLAQEREDAAEAAAAAKRAAKTKKTKKAARVDTDEDTTTLAMARPPEVKRKGCIENDGRFCKYADGTVLDTRTNLMWAARDNGSNINWQGAKNYCDNYSGGGYTDWRMPTQDELAGLYDAAKTQQNEAAPSYPLHLTELIDLTSCCPWASDTRGSDAAFFIFTYGARYWGPQSDGVNGRALPVRSGK